MHGGTFHLSIHTFVNVKYMLTLHVLITVAMLLLQRMIDLKCLMETDLGEHHLILE